MSNYTTSTPGKKKILLWSPHRQNSKQFVVGGTDLRLYELKIQGGRKGTSQIKFSLEDPSSKEAKKDKKFISLVSVNYEVQQIKCLAWCPDPVLKLGVVSNDIPDFNSMAVGLSNGKVILTSLKESEKISNRIVKEFVPKHSRTCNAVAWNPKYTNLLAVGLDKVRSDFSTLVWDVNEKGTLEQERIIDASQPIMAASDSSFNIAPVEAAETVVKPVCELANSEATVALSWMPHMPQCLVTGTGVKWLRIYDTRGDVNAPQSVVAHARSVHGVAFDPFDSNRLITYSEDGLVKLWDLRNFSEAGLTQIDWCPTRSGILASISKEEKGVKFWDIKDAIGQKSDKGEFSLKPYRTHDMVEPISSFSWNLYDQYRMLSVTNSGIVEVVSLQETIPLAWSSNGPISFGYGKYLVEACITETENTSNQDLWDITSQMKKRAIQGYSMDIAGNKKLLDSNASSNKELKVLWSWMHDYSISTCVDSTLHVEIFQGIQSIIQGGVTAASTKKQDQQMFPTYWSPQRQICSQICGWGFEKKDALEQALLKLENEGQYERAAAIAIFHIEIRRAILSLTKSHTAERSVNGNNLKLLAMALAGFNDQGMKGSGLWRDTCLDPALLGEIKHPYLRACFAFLCNDTKGFKSVLSDPELSLCDRVAFACRYLDDTELTQFIESLITEFTKQGGLEGIILTGLTNTHCVDIFEQYLNLVGDVQTAALALSHVIPKKFKDSRVDNWVRIYRELLDMWQQWNNRAKFDMARIDPVPQQIFVRCNFCNQPLSMARIVPRTRVTTSSAPSTGPTPQSTARPSTGVTTSSTTGISSKQPIQKQKTSHCPSCKKPLPRCALCLLAFNCSVPNFGVKGQPTSTSNSSFGDWFTWCQTCRHGGHSSHMLDWFKNHQECPVTDCTCKCLFLKYKPEVCQQTSCIQKSV